MQRSGGPVRMTAYPVAQMGTTALTCKCACQSHGGDSLMAGTCEVRRWHGSCAGADAERPSEGLGVRRPPEQTRVKTGRKLTHRT